MHDVLVRRTQFCKQAHYIETICKCIVLTLSCCTNIVTTLFQVCVPARSSCSKLILLLVYQTLHFICCVQDTLASNLHCPFTYQAMGTIVLFIMANTTDPDKSVLSESSMFDCMSVLIVWIFMVFFTKEQKLETS